MEMREVHPSERYSFLWSLRVSVRGSCRWVLANDCRFWWTMEDASGFEWRQGSFCRIGQQLLDGRDKAQS